jgi:hypothetical protein
MRQDDIETLHALFQKIRDMRVLRSPENGETLERAIGSLECIRKSLAKKIEKQTERQQYTSISMIIDLYDEVDAAIELHSLAKAKLADI